MAFILSVNAAVTRKDEFGQIWIIVLKEKSELPLGILNSQNIPCFN